MVKYPNTCLTSVTESKTVKREQFSAGLSAKLIWTETSPTARQHITIPPQKQVKQGGVPRDSPYNTHLPSHPRNLALSFGQLLRDQRVNMQTLPSLWFGLAWKLIPAITKAKKGSLLIKAQNFASRDLDCTFVTYFLGGWEQIPVPRCTSLPYPHPEVKHSG